MTQLILHHPRQDKLAIVTCRDKDVTVQIGTQGHKGRTTTHPVREDYQAWEKTEQVVTQLLLEGWEPQSCAMEALRIPLIVQAFVPGDGWDAIQQAGIAAEYPQTIARPPTPTFVPLGIGAFHARKLATGFDLKAVIWTPAMYNAEEERERDLQVAFVALIANATCSIRGADGTEFTPAEWLRSRHQGLAHALQRNLEKAMVLPSNPLNHEDAFGVQRSSVQFTCTL